MAELQQNMLAAQEQFDQLEKWKAMKVGRSRRFAVAERSTATRRCGVARVGSTSTAVSALAIEAALAFQGVLYCIVRQMGYLILS